MNSLVYWQQIKRFQDNILVTKVNGGEIEFIPKPGSNTNFTAGTAKIEGSFLFHEGELNCLEETWGGTAPTAVIHITSLIMKD